MRRAVLLAVATVVLAVAAVVLLVAGVDVRETTGGLLVTPIRQLHLVGGLLLAGTAAGVAAVLTALVAVPALRAARAPADRRHRRHRRPSTLPSRTMCPLTRPWRTTPTTPRPRRAPIAARDRRLPA